MTPGHSCQGGGGGEFGLTAEPEAGRKRGQGLRAGACGQPDGPPGVVYRLGAGEWLLWRGQGAQEDLGSQVPWRRASADRASPGTRWAGSSRCSCTGYRSRPPPRRHSWTGRAPRTCPAGERPRSDPPAAQNASPGDWDPGRGVRPLLCSGAAPEPLLSGHRQARVGSQGLPSPPGAAGGRRAASPPRGCHGLAHADKRGRPGGTAAAGGTSPAGTGGCQASVTSPPRDWPWLQFLLCRKNVLVNVTTY